MFFDNESFLFEMFLTIQRYSQGKTTRINNSMQGFM